MQHNEVLEVTGLRVDGRKTVDVRRLQHRLGFVKSADGSAYFEQGLNKLLVTVHGPHEPKKRQSDASGEQCVISCHVVNAPFSGSERKKRRPGDRRLLEMETAIRQVAEEMIVLNNYPRSEISIVVHILQADGSVICSIINALCLALMDGGIAMSDMIVACTVGFVQKELCLDLTLLEYNAGGAVIPMAIKAHSEEVVYLQLGSRLAISHLENAMQFGLIGCRKIKKYIEAAIRDSMNVATER